MQVTALNFLFWVTGCHVVCLALDYCKTENDLPCSLLFGSFPKVLGWQACTSTPDACSSGDEPRVPRMVGKVFFFTNQAAFPVLYLTLKEALMPLSKVFEPLCVCNCNILKSELAQNTTGFGCKPFHLNASLRVV